MNDFARNLGLPSYFLDGPQAGTVLRLTGSPMRFRFPVPPEIKLWETQADLDFMSEIAFQTDEYERVQPVVLYKYLGRY